MKKSIMFLVCLLLLAGSVSAQTARLVHYQGSLTGSAGAPFNGTTDLTIAIYNTPRSEDAVWTETHTAVQVTDGEYSLMLGGINPLKLSFYEYFVEVRASAGQPPEGRTMIVGSGYNYRLGFLFAAYTIVWLAIFFYVVSISRRQKKIISDLEILAEAGRQKEAA